MEGKSGSAMKNLANVGKKPKLVSPEWQEEVGSFHLYYAAAECVKQESFWRSLYIEQSASRPHCLLFTLGRLNSSAKDLLGEGAAAAEYSWAQTVGTLSPLLFLANSATGGGEQERSIDAVRHFPEVIALSLH